MYLCFNGLCDCSDLSVLLQDFTGDVEVEVIAVHKTCHKAVVVRDEVLCLIHDEDTFGVQFKTWFKV